MWRIISLRIALRDWNLLLDDGCLFEMTVKERRGVMKLNFLRSLEVNMFGGSARLNRILILCKANRKQNQEFTWQSAIVIDGDIIEIQLQKV